MRHLLPMTLLTLAAIAASRPALAQAPAQALAGGLQVHAANAVATTPPPGTDLWSGFAFAAGSGPIAASLAGQHAATASDVEIDWQLAGRAQATGVVSSVGDVRYEFAFARPFVGELVVAWSSTTTGTGAASLAVDVGDDGTVEASGSGSVFVAMWPGVLVLRVRASCTATGGVIHGPFGSSWSYAGTGQAALTVRLVPTHCHVQELGLACAAPAFAVAGNLRYGVDFTANCSPTADLAILSVGSPMAPVPCPLTAGCALLVAPDVLAWQAVGAQATARWSVDLPMPAGGMLFGAQAIELDLDTFSASAGRACSVSCP